MTFDNCLLFPEAVAEKHANKDILLMHLRSYCWWKTSCITYNLWNLLKNLYSPYQLVQDFFHQQYLKELVMFVCQIAVNVDQLDLQQNCMFLMVIYVKFISNKNDNFNHFREVVLGWPRSPFHYHLEVSGRVGRDDFFWMPSFLGTELLEQNGSFSRMEEVSCPIRHQWFSGWQLS